MSVSNGNDERFKVVIIGAGVAGLSVAAFLRQRTSFQLQVLEKSDISLEADPDTDYGITIASNGTAVLAELGMKDAAAELAGCEMSQMSNCPAEEVHSSKHCTPFHSRHLSGFPTVFTRRNAMVSWLRKKCLEVLDNKAPVEIASSTRIVKIDIEAKTAFDESGHEYSGDLLVCADGIAKLGRKAIMLLTKEKVLNNGEEEEETAVQAAYMTIVPLSAIRERPSLAHFLPDEHGNQTLSNWIYDDPAAVDDNALGARLQRRFIIYPLDDKGNFQVFAYRPATRETLQRFNCFGRDRAGKDKRGWSIIRNEPSRIAMEQFSMFHKEVQSLLGLRPSLDLCLIRDSDTIHRWAYSHKAVLVGDAAHATVPHTGQGFSQALEDAETLSYLLSRCDVTSPPAIQAALAKYEKLRIPRAHEVQLTSRLLNGTREGIEQLDQQAFYNGIVSGWKRTETVLSL